MKKRLFTFYILFTVLCSLPWNKALADFALYFEKNKDGDDVVRIAATYYVKEGDNNLKTMAENAVKFWNNESGQFVLCTGDKKNPPYYIVIFNLKVVTTADPSIEMRKDKQGDSCAITKDRSSNIFTMVMEMAPYDIAKTTSNNEIKIRHSEQNNGYVGPHEIGHTLLMKHQPTSSESIMADGATGAMSVFRQDVLETICQAIYWDQIYLFNNGLFVHYKPDLVTVNGTKVKYYWQIKTQKNTEKDRSFRDVARLKSSI